MFKIDWGQISPLLVDPVGDNTFFPDRDVLNISITSDGTHVYFLLEFASLPIFTSDLGPGLITLALDTDENLNTGFPQHGVGAEYAVSLADGFGAPTVFLGHFMFEEGAWRFSSADSPGDSAFVQRGRFFEISIKIDALRVLTPATTGFTFWATGGGDAVFDSPPAIYRFR